MARRNTAMALVALLLMCSAVIAMDGTDGEGTEQIGLSGAVYHTEMEMDLPYMYDYLRFFIPGSDNEKRMLEWLEDRDCDMLMIPDDREVIVPGQTVSVYHTSDLVEHVTISYRENGEDVQIRFSLIAGPQEATYFVKTGVPFTIDVPSEYKDSVTMYIDNVESSSAIGKTKTLQKDAFVTIRNNPYMNDWTEVPITASGAQRVTPDNIDTVMDGYEKARVSGMFVKSALSTMTDVRQPEYGEFVFKEGSANEIAMKEFIENGTGDIMYRSQYSSCIKDDWGYLEEGDRMVVYLFTTWEDDKVQTGHNVHNEKVVKSPDKLSFFLKVGDVLELDLIPSPMHKVYLETSGFSGTIEESHQTIEATISETVSIGTRDIYADFYYSVSGNSEPNGSAMAYIVICIVVAAVAMAVMFLCNRPPKWAK